MLTQAAHQLSLSQTHTYTLAHTLNLTETHFLYNSLDNNADVLLRPGDVKCIAAK